jgi:hypothetical protein
MKVANTHPPAPLGKIEYADLYTFTLTDGTTLLYTTFDSDVLIQGPGGNPLSPYGGQAYGSGLFLFKRGPLIQRSKLSNAIGLTPSELSLTISSKTSDIAQPFLQFNWPYAVLKGLFDWAQVKLWRLFGPFTYDTKGRVTLGYNAGRPVPLFFGYVAEIVSASRRDVQIRCLDARVLLNTTIPRHTISPYCRWVLYGAGCLLNAENFGVNTSALAGSSASILLANLTQVSGYFDLGYVKFLSGQNQGQQAPVTAYLPANVTYASLVLQQKPKGYWRLNETSGTTAHDLSGNGNNGTISGHVTIGEPSLLVGDPSGGSFRFNPTGTDGLVSLPIPAPNAWGGGPVTIEFIVNNTAGAHLAVFETSPGAPSSLRCNTALAGTAMQVRWLDKPQITVGLDTFNATHVAIVIFDSRTMAIYINGSLFGTSSASRPNAVDWSGFTLGQVAANPVGTLLADYFHGYIAEFAIYNRALDDNTIAIHALVAINGPTSKSSATIELLTPLPVVPNAGDAFRIYPGCDLTEHTCGPPSSGGKFDNLQHYGGFKKVPDTETAF